MDSIILPNLWILASALTIIILLVVFSYHVYFRSRIKAVTETTGDIAQLAARKEQLQADVDSLSQWITEQREELLRLTAEREGQEVERANLQRLLEKCATTEQEYQNFRNQVGELENQRYLLTQSLEQHRREIGELEMKRGDLQLIHEQLTQGRSEFQKLSDELGKLRLEEEGIRRSMTENEIRLNVLNHEKGVLEQRMEDLNEKMQHAKSEYERVTTAAQEAAIEATEAEKRLAKLMDQERQINENLQNIGRIIEDREDKKTFLERTVASLQEQSSNLKQDVETLGRRVTERRQESEQASREADGHRVELQSLIQDKTKLDVHFGALQAQIARLEQDLGRLRGVTPEPGADRFPQYKDLLEQPPLCLALSEFDSHPRPEYDESQALIDLQDNLRSQGFLFSERVIKAFHTSLKCSFINPLTVLAGVSGTGKTLLPVKYAEMMGMHCLIIAVQPRWDSPQDLFGFYNYLEKQYKATDLSRALIRLDTYNYPVNNFPMLENTKATDRMLLVLMDEMNLARTEYYFSEFLSKLEIRRLVVNPDNDFYRERAEFLLDTGPGEAERFRIWVGDNVLFVGTMNEDETTQSLSDKVLDRANVLRFGKPDENTPLAPAVGQSERDSNGYLTKDQWRSWVRVKKYEPNNPWHTEIMGWIRQLNEALERIGRPFGYRVQEAIGLYVANYPGVYQQGVHKLAFSDQVEQKIMPKLRGIELNEKASGQTLDEISQIIDDLGDQDLSRAFKMAREDESTGMFIWRGVTRPVNPNA